MPACRSSGGIKKYRYIDSLNIVTEKEKRSSGIERRGGEMISQKNDYSLQTVMIN